MEHIDAIYENGVFRPLTDVSLAERQRVRLSVQAVEVANDSPWDERVREFHRAFLQSRGPLPDSTPEIAEDRLRDA